MFRFGKRGISLVWILLLAVPLYCSAQTSGGNAAKQAAAAAHAAMVAGTTSAPTGTRHYYYTDPQGTVLAKTDASGNIIATYDYAPYGTVVTSSGMSGAPNGPGYTGHVNDPESGFVYMQARYYDPMGRMLSVDPVGPTPGNLFSFNRYAYANNNPIANMDPDGRESACVEESNHCNGPSPNSKAAGQLLGSLVANGLDKLNEATAPLLAAQPEIGVALEGLEALPMALGSAADVAGTADVAGAAVRGGAEVPLPEEMILARGGNAANQTADKIDAAIGPSRTPGISGFSVQCGMCTSEAGANLRNSQMGVTTVGDVRAAGGDAIATAGYGNHATVTGLTGEQANPLFKVVKNPNPSTN